MSTLVAWVADCYFAQGLPWLIPVMPHEALHSIIHSFIHSFLPSYSGAATALSAASRPDDTAVDGTVMLPYPAAPQSQPGALAG